MSCSESPAANSFLVDSLISSGRGEAAGAGGGGGGGGGYYPNSGIYLPQASDLSYGLQSCGLFPVLGKRNEGTSQSMVPNSHSYVSGMEVWLDPPRGSAGSAPPPSGPLPRGCPGPARPRLRSRLQCGLSAAAERATATSPGPLPSPPPPPFVFAARPRAMGGLPPGPPPAASAAAAAERGTLRGGKEGGEKDRKLTRCSFNSIYILAVVIMFAFKK
uniref:Uncharacterized protein n=1 Tax=Zonotrichia albicollis TaxID=44394 RepID=A0A8D2MXN4_ZONAL